MNWPNFISLGRVFSVPLIIWLIASGRMSWAFIIFLLAGLSDILDGLLARALKNRTVIGAYLDPLADKVLLVGVFITLGILHYIPFWIIILAVFRDILILGGTLLLKFLEKPLRIQPLVISKINTFLQISLISLVMGQKALDFSLPSLNTLFVLLTTCTTILSGMAYVAVWVKQVNHT